MSRKLLMGLVMMVLLASVAWAAESEKFSKNADAQAFLGSFVGEITVPPGVEGVSQSTTRKWELVLSAIDDKGNVTIKKYNLGAAGRYPAETITDAKAYFETQRQGQLKIILEVPGRDKIELTHQKGNLVAESRSATFPQGIILIRQK